jgi:hypothetical protein
LQDPDDAKRKDENPQYNSGVLPEVIHHTHDQASWVFEGTGGLRREGDTSVRFCAASNRYQGRGELFYAAPSGRGIRGQSIELRSRWLVSAVHVPLC